MLTTKNLLTVTALLEAPTGIALLVAPSVPASLLLGASLDAAGLALARVAGAAMLSLGIACWLVRLEGASRSGQAMTLSMLVYNVAVAAILAHASLGQGLSAVLLWPAVGLHAALAVWCSAGLRHDRLSPSSPPASGSSARDRGAS